MAHFQLCNFTPFSNSNDQYNISTEEAPVVCESSEVLLYLENLYRPIHGYLTTVVCILGVVTNCLNTLVLLQPPMRLPTNILLLAVAVADMLTMSSYLLYTVRFILITTDNYRTHDHPSGWIAFLIIHNAIIITSHTAATLLIVALGVFRCLTLYGVCQFQPRNFSRNRSSSSSSSSSASPYCCIVRRRVTLTNYHAYATVGVISAASIIFCLPNHAFYRICEVHPGAFWFHTVPREWSTLLDLYRFTVYGCFVKMLSSFFITALTGLLIAALKKAKLRRHRLQQHMAPPITLAPHDNSDMVASVNDVTSMAPNANLSVALHRRRQRRHVAEHQRTTTLLILVAVVFVLIELPQGILNTMAAFDKDDCFINSVYLPMGNLMDALVVLGSCVNFVLYCCMSQQFRETFSKLFFRNPCIQECWRLLKPAQRGRPLPHAVTMLGDGLDGLQVPPRQTGSQLRLGIGETTLGTTKRTCPSSPHLIKHV